MVSALGSIGKTGQRLSTEFPDSILNGFCSITDWAGSDYFGGAEVSKIKIVVRKSIKIDGYLAFQ